MAQVIDINSRRIALLPTVRPGCYRVQADPATKLADIRRLAKKRGGVLRTDLRGMLMVELPVASNWQPDGAA